MAKTIGIGVIGIGMGSTMLPLNDDPSSPFEVRSLCAATEAKVRDLATQRGIRHWTTDYRDLVTRNDVDVVAVYSPDHQHVAHVVAALEAGKHVVCTKPMVTSVADAERIVDLVDQTGLKFLVGQTMRFEPEFVAVKAQLDAGLIGDVIFVEGHYVHDMRHVYPYTPWRRDVPQDLMFGGVSHPVDILRWLCGDIEEVHAYATRGGLTPEVTVKQNFLLNVRFASGVIGRVLGAYDIVHPPIPMMEIRIYGTRATIVADYTDRKGGSVQVVYDSFEGQPTGRFEFPAETLGAYGHGETVLRYMRHFQQCLEQDMQPSPGVRDGAKSVATCAAAWESITSGAVARVRNEF
jgi:predicted dehydrogenase